MKTFSAKPHEVVHGWFVVDATDKILGCVASEIARRLRGKHKPEFTPHVDTGDFIVVTNVEKLRVTGNKAEDKKYFRHSGYPGGLRTETYAAAMVRKPEDTVRNTVRGMIPHNRLGRAQLKKLKVYSGPNHPHSAQSPQPFEVAGARARS